MPPTTATAESGMDRRQVHAKRVGEPLEVAGPTARILLAGGLGRADGGPGARHAGSQRGRRPAGRPGRAGVSASRAPTPPSSAVLDQVGAQPALHVGAGAHPQQVQRDQLGGVAGAPAVRSALTAPSIAAQIEPSTSSPARTAIATRGIDEPSARQVGRVDEDRLVARGRGPGRRRAR